MLMLGWIRTSYQISFSFRNPKFDGEPGGGTARVRIITRIPDSFAFPQDSVAQPKLRRQASCLDLIVEEMRSVFWHQLIHPPGSRLEEPRHDSQFLLFLRCLRGSQIRALINAFPRTK